MYSEVLKENYPEPYEIYNLTRSKNMNVFEFIIDFKSFTLISFHLSFDAQYCAMISFVLNMLNELLDAWKQAANTTATNAPATLISPNNKKRQNLCRFFIDCEALFRRVFRP